METQYTPLISNHAADTCETPSGIKSNISSKLSELTNIKIVITSSITSREITIKIIFFSI